MIIGTLENCPDCRQIKCVCPKVIGKPSEKEEIITMPKDRIDTRDRTFMNEKEILDEFDKQFVIDFNGVEQLAYDYDADKWMVTPENIRQFISKSLSDQRETFLNQPANEHDQEVRNQLRKEIEKECNKLIDKCIGENDENYSYIYQKAVEDVIKII